ncbi:MAG TPA: ABC transporter ATP-binding protein [Candidatus Limnocylindrales bacterium]|jgi:ATP-binding cassette subfamily B protein|nr:ABC transporter ATP-binding protein [Candidatus Limnocylindrales bacterium]
MSGRGGGFGRMAAGADFERVPKERRGRTIRRIAAFFRPYKAQVSVVLGAILLTSFIGLVNPILLKLLIDIAIPERDWVLLNLFVGLMIVLPVISGLIGVGQSYLNNVIGQSVMHDLRTALYSHLQRMPLRFFTETRTGEIQSRLANDVGGIQSVVTDTAASVTSNIAIALSTVIAMFVIDWRLTFLSLGLLPFFMYLTFRVGKVNREVRGETQKSLAEMSAATEETLSVSGMLLSKTFGQQKAAINRFSKLNRELARLQVRQAMVGRWFFMIIGTIFSITPAFVYWLAGYLAIQGDPSAPTIGDIVAFTTLQSRLFFPLGQLLNVQVEIQGALALFDRIFEYLEMDPEIVDAPDAITLDRERIRGRVAFREVSFRYPAAAVPATPPAATAAATEPALAAVPPIALVPPFGLEGIDFEVNAGQLVALVGPSGSGKTTTTYLVPRLYDVDAGAVEIDGHDVKSVTLASLGDVIGFVTQETYLFHDTIRANLLYAKPDATDAELETATRAAAIHDRIGELPNGYDTVVGERGYKLSGGEKQRIAIARVLLKDPRILILDEATSALDTVSERLIQAALERLMEGRTTIAIAHRLSTILRADQILVYDRGRIVERGTHGELVGQGGLYARLYREQFLSEPGDGARSNGDGDGDGLGEVEAAATILRP